MICLGDSFTDKDELKYRLFKDWSANGIIKFPKEYSSMTEVVAWFISLYRSQTTFYILCEIGEYKLYIYWSFTLSWIELILSAFNYW